MTTDQSRWLFPKDYLLNSPSVRSGYSHEKELSMRQQAAQLIQTAGVKLKVSFATICTAVVYMHRFYVFHSFQRFNYKTIAACALFLAAKVEEELRKLEFVIKACHEATSPEKEPKPTPEEIQKEMEDLVTHENIMLQTLGFDIIVKHPHLYVLDGCEKIRANIKLSKTAYMFATTSLQLTTMCLRYPPTVIACFCIYLVHEWDNLEIPRSIEGREWYSYIDPNVTTELLKGLLSEFLSVIEKLPPPVKKKILSCRALNGPSMPDHLIPSTSRQDPNRRPTVSRPVEVNHRSSHGASNSVSVHRGPQMDSRPPLPLEARSKNSPIKKGENPSTARPNVTNSKPNLPFQNLTPAIEESSTRSHRAPAIASFPRPPPPPPRAPQIDSRPVIPPEIKSSKNSPILKEENPPPPPPPLARPNVMNSKPHPPVQNCTATMEESSVRSHRPPVVGLPSFPRPTPPPPRPAQMDTRPVGPPEAKSLKNSPIIKKEENPPIIRANFPNPDSHPPVQNSTAAIEESPIRSHKTPVIASFPKPPPPPPPPRIEAISNASIVRSHDPEPNRLSQSLSSNLQKDKHKEHREHKDHRGEHGDYKEYKEPKDHKEHKDHRDHREKERKHKKRKHEKHKDKDRDRDRDKERKHERKHSKDREKDKHHHRSIKEEHHSDQDDHNFSSSSHREVNRGVEQDPTNPWKIKISKKLSDSESELSTDASTRPSFRIVIPKDRLGNTSSTHSSHKRKVEAKSHDREKRFRSNDSDSSN